MRGGALGIDDFLGFIKALAAIGALAEAGIGRFCITVATECGFPQVGLTDGIADADIHGRANLSCEAFAAGTLCEPFLLTSGFLRGARERPTSLPQWEYRTVGQAAP